MNFKGDEMKLGLAEILEEASKPRKNSDKAAVLRKYASPPLYIVLKYALDPKVKWGLPEGSPEYKPSPYLDNEGLLYAEIRTLYMFVDEGDDFMNLDQYKLITREGLKKKPIKRQNLFVQLLESVMPADAQLLLAMKEKKLPYRITAKVVEEAFPGLLDLEDTKVG